MLIDRIEIKKDYLPYKDLILEFTKNNVAGNELLIFGRNGTGKTTISTSIYEGTRNGNNNSDINFYKDDQLLNEERINEKNVFVYNEAFIDEKVKFTMNNNLEAIVMLGNQGDYHELLERLNKRLTNIKEKYNKYNDRTNSFNEEAELKKIKKLLKGDDSWAGREQKVKLGKINPEVTDNTVSNVLRHSNDESDANLIMELERTSENLVDVSQKLHIEKAETEKIYIEYTYQAIQIVLRRIFSINFSNSEIEKRIESIFNNFGKEDIEGTYTYLNTKADYCKTCFQDIDSEYKNDLKEKILDILNYDSVQKVEQEVSQHIKLLPDNLEKVGYNDVVPKHIVNALNQSISKVNGINDEVKDLLLQKKKNMSKTLLLQIDKIHDAYRELDLSTSDYNKVIESYEDKFLENNRTKTTYSTLNYKLAYKEIQDSYKLYENNLSKNDFHKYMKLKIKEIETHLDRKVRYIKSKLAQTQIALEDINTTLSLIFYDRHRLELIDENGFYTVKVRGRKTPLKNLSTGEKNIIGLSYFFSLLHMGKSINQKYKDSLLIVLDDPISSFDFENKMGIYNFLRKEMELVLINNSESQILVTTHDAEVFSSFDKLLLDIKVNDKAIIKNLNRRLLTNQGLIDTKRSLNNTYTEQLESIYNFSIGLKQEELVNYIGNTMRRVFESYSTFNYKCGVSDLIRKEEILKKLPSDKEREFFGKLMIRLLLNNESHGQYQAQYHPDINVYDFLSLEEKVRTAKLLIFYLYRLDDVHVQTHLKGVCDNIEDKIQEWQDLIN